MIKKIVAEWKYDPKEYFEDIIHIVDEKYDLQIRKGEIEAGIHPRFIDNAKDIIDEIDRKIQSMFLAVQVMNHQPFNLSEPSRYDLRLDGKKNFYLNVKAGVIKISTGTVDLVVKDKDGKIISDTKSERIDKKKWFAETSAKHRQNDYVLDRMLKSYHKSVVDPDNELIHLYEIRDAVADKFENGSKARKTLNVTNIEWNVLGKLANKEPLLQGRHRGLAAGKLRKAEALELKTARQVAAKIIENYMVYLENIR